MRYLMLDKDDITNVCGVISLKEVLEELGFNHHQFYHFLDNNKIFRDKYYLVEEMQKKASRVFTKILGVRNNREYFCKSDGTFFVKYKSGKIKQLSVFKNTKGKASVSILGRTTEAHTIIAREFIVGHRKGDIVMYKDNNELNINVDNLLSVKKEIYSKRTGAMSKSKAVVMLDDEGNVIKRWSSARKASKTLFCSYQTVMDICNKKVKKQMFKLKWEIEKE